MLVVADSSPLIGLCRIGMLHLLREAFKHVVAPDAVWREITSADASKTGVQELLEASWIERRSVTDIHLVHLLRKDLGPGESEAIVLAREIAADFLLMDERMGRSAAQRIGLRWTGRIFNRSKTTRPHRRRRSHSRVTARESRILGFSRITRSTPEELICAAFQI